MKRIAMLLCLALSPLVFAQDKTPPTTLKGVLLEQLRTTHNEKDWFVPANIAVQGLTVEQANWSPGKGSHSVVQEVNHLIFWDAWSLAKFKGEKPPAKYSGNNDDTFNGADSKQWAAMVK